MAIYGNRNTGEITPNNFATRPGVIPGKIASAPSTDYLFGSNLGILQEENNLSISKATIRSAIPRPFMLGAFPTFPRINWIDNNGNVTVSDKPGLGVLYDWDFLKKHTLYKVIID